MALVEGGLCAGELVAHARLGEVCTFGVNPGRSVKFAAGAAMKGWRSILSAPSNVVRAPRRRQAHPDRGRIVDEGGVGPVLQQPAHQIGQQIPHDCQPAHRRAQVLSRTRLADCVVERLAHAVQALKLVGVIAEFRRDLGARHTANARYGSQNWGIDAGRL